MRTSMVIFVAHGSRDPRWRASVESLIESLQADLGPDSVRLAYLDYAPPTLLDVASDAVRAGVGVIRVVPLFLARQGHVQRDIRPAVDRLREVAGQIDVELLPPVGEHRLFRELLREIAVQSSR